MLATAVVLRPRPAALAIVALIAVWILGYAAYSWIPEWIETPIPVNDAVGGAAVFESSYLDGQLAGALLLGLVLVAGILFAILTRHEQDGGEPAGQTAPPTRRTRILTLAAGALVILTLLPDLRHVLIDGTRGPLPAGWDAANFIAWDYFEQHGLTPMTDYWYPYGGAWLLADFPTGPIALWAWQAFLLAVAGWALWRLAGPRPGRIALCLLAVVAVGLFDPIDAPGFGVAWRYVPGLIVAVCYAAVGPLRHRRLTPGHLVFAAACGAVAAMGTDVFIAGIAGAAFVALGEFVFDPALRSWRTIRAAVIDVLPVLAGIGCMLAFWAATGSLDQNLSWFTAFRGVSAASAALQDAFGALRGLDADPSLVTVLATIPALLLTAAFYQRRFGGAAGIACSRVLLAAAGFAAVILAKHLVRPQGTIVLFVPLVALLWTAILQWHVYSMRSAVAAGLFAGALLGLLQVTGAVKPTRYLGDVFETPVRAVKDATLVLDRGKIRAAGNGRFAPERFAAIPEKTFIADKLASGLSGPGDSRFAVLGDAQILYVLFGQRPPGHITLYDAARRSQQERWIDGVRKLDPRLLIWRRDLNIDGVQYWVRNPLVFAHAIANYVLQTESDPMDVLRKRRPGEPVSVGYWRKRIGDTVNLGGIPSYSRGDELERCSGGSGCVPYAIVTGPADRPKAQVTVKLRGTPYAAQFDTRDGVGSYAIRLDRLWFWPYKGTSNVALSSATPGWRVEQTGVRAGEDLY